MLFESSPSAKGLGISELLVLLKENHPAWHVGEERLRIVRQAYNDAEAKKNMTSHSDGAAFVHKDQSVVNEIGSDGVEHLFMPMMGAYFKTGREFQNDEATGEWVL
jgi:predicted oxidoreductase (fatty acid repression mutant protein)